MRQGSIPRRPHCLRVNGARARPFFRLQEVVMEQMPEDARVSVHEVDGQWIVRVVGAGEIIEQSFEDEKEAEEFAFAHRRRLGLHVPPDVS
jgi:hypothetical protein